MHALAERQKAQVCVFYKVENPAVLKKFCRQPIAVRDKANLEL